MLEERGREQGRGGRIEGEVEEHSSQQQSGKVLEQSSRAVARRRWVVVDDDGQVVVAGASFLDFINLAWRGGLLACFSYSLLYFRLL
jgi:hypothetical protein